MNVPNLPTDNIYKFITLTGVVLLVLSFIYPEIKRKEIRDEITLHEGEVDILRMEQFKDSIRLNEIRKEVRELDSESNCDCTSLVSDTLIVRTRIIDGPPELVEQSKEIDLLIDEWKKTRDQLNMKTSKLNTKSQLIIDKTGDLAEIDEAVEFFAPILFFSTFLGFFIWYEKTQKYQDKLVKEQVSNYPLIQHCQSCGMKLSNQEEYTSFSESERKSKYCKTCYTDGDFNEPDITLEEMKEKVRNRCKELNFDRLTTWVATTRLKNLDRWRKKFKW